MNKTLPFEGRAHPLLQGLVLSAKSAVQGVEGVVPRAAEASLLMGSQPWDPTTAEREGENRGALRCFPNPSKSRITSTSHLSGVPAGGGSFDVKS